MSEESKYPSTSTFSFAKEQDLKMQSDCQSLELVKCESSADSDERSIKTTSSRDILSSNNPSSAVINTCKISDRTISSSTVLPTQGNTYRPYNASHNGSSYHTVPYVYRGPMAPPAHYPHHQMSYSYPQHMSSTAHVQFSHVVPQSMFDSRYAPAPGTRVSSHMTHHPGYYYRNPYHNAPICYNHQQYPTMHGHPTTFGPVSSNGYITAANSSISSHQNQQEDSNSCVQSSASVSSSDTNSRKRIFEGGVEPFHSRSGPAFSIRRSDSLSSAGSVTTATNASSGYAISRKLVCESPIHREQENGIAVVISQDSLSFEVDKKEHRRRGSHSSTESSLTIGGLSMGSHEKRGRSGSLSSDINCSDGNEWFSKRQRASSQHQLSASHGGSKTGHNDKKETISLTPLLFPTEMGKTPVSKNTASVKDKPNAFDQTPIEMERWMSSDHAISFEDSGVKGQSFTPLMTEDASRFGRDQKISPEFHGAFSDFEPQLSWSMVGDSPPFGDIMNWGDEESKQNSSTGESPLSLNGEIIQPILWKDEEILKMTEMKPQCNRKSSYIEGKKESDNDDAMLRIPIWSPKSMGDDIFDTQLTPLPVLFDKKAKGREVGIGLMPLDKKAKETDKYCITDRKRDVRPSNSRNKDQLMSSEPLTPNPKSNHRPRKTDVFEDDYRPFDRRQDNRVRNLRGNMPLTSPQPLNIMSPYRFSSQSTNFTSPMSPIGSVLKDSLWRSPRYVAPHHHQKSHQMTNSKRRCVPLKPPLPTKYQGDIEKMKSVQIPEFTTLVNYPSYMSQKQSYSLPEGMRCCVMCGHACPSFIISKNKKNTIPRRSKSLDDNGCSEFVSSSHGYPTIPTQNKGLCTRCDVNVWIIVASGLEIKWCKGCKNFRPWAAFGEKGFATKCVRCRDRQREKYALQKEEKDKGTGKSFAEEVEELLGA